LVDSPEDIPIQSEKESEPNDTSIGKFQTKFGYDGTMNIEEVSNFQNEEELDTRMLSGRTGGEREERGGEGREEDERDEVMSEREEVEK
jgi:hypothetical protein